MPDRQHIDRQQSWEHPDILPVWTPWVTFYVLRDPAAEALCLIDGGFIGGMTALQRALQSRGWDGLPIKGILLTHGHLDHTWNIAALVAKTGAWVAAPRLDAMHCQGRFPYRGWSRVCGALELVGRKLLGYQQFRVDTWIDEGTRFPIGEGLTAVHLPGHTDGHMGFHLSQSRLLFSGDLFASFGTMSHLPPRILNTDSAKLRQSVARLLRLDLFGVLPNHGWPATPTDHLVRLRKLGDSLQRH